jgi:hypothetical protein
VLAFLFSHPSSLLHSEWRLSRESDIRNHALIHCYYRHMRSQPAGSLPTTVGGHGATQQATPAAASTSPPPATAQSGLERGVESMNLGVAR